MKTIGFAGTAKNTGKTTTTLEVLNRALSYNLSVALTSIGYDGENRDNVTGLPKPRFVLAEGMWVATARGCLQAGSADIEVRLATGIQTALGEIVIGVVRRPGTVLIAGPNRSTDLITLFTMLAERHVELTLVDGALNRLVPMICTDGMVLSTGAAFNQDIEILVAHAVALLRLMQPEVETGIGPDEHAIRIFTGRREMARITSGSLLGQAAQNRLQEALMVPVAILAIPGACEPARLEALLDSRGSNLEGARLVFGSPLKLVASGDPLHWSRIFHRLGQMGAEVRYFEKNPVCFMTVNPFYPHYHPGSGVYEPAYVDKVALLSTFRSRISKLPVIDILQPPVPDLLALLGVADRPKPDSAQENKAQVDP